MESCAGFVNGAAGGEVARAAGDGGSCVAQSGECGCDGAGLGPAAGVEMLRRGKTGGVFDFCDSDCGRVFEAGSAGESRRVRNGGVGTLGGVADRLDVGARGGLSFLGFLGRFQRTFFGGRNGAESAGSISIIVSGSVVIFVITVTNGGSGAG